MTLSQDCPSWTESKRSATAWNRENECIVLAVNSRTAINARTNVTRLTFMRNILAPGVTLCIAWYPEWLVYIESQA